MGFIYIKSINNFLNENLYWMYSRFRSLEIKRMVKKKKLYLYREDSLLNAKIFRIDLGYTLSRVHISSAIYALPPARNRLPILKWRKQATWQTGISNWELNLYLPKQKCMRMKSRLYPSSLSKSKRRNGGGLIYSQKHICDTDLWHRRRESR